MTQQDPILEFKRAFQPSKEAIHLNNAGTAPLCRAAYDTSIHWLSRLRNEGANAAAVLPDAMETARLRLAKLINASPEHLAFFQGAANAISQVAFGLKLKSGDEIITFEQEYPSNFYPWRDIAIKTGAKLVVIPSNDELSTPVDEIISRVTPRTRIIAFSWVQYQAGAILDLETLTAFARSKGILTSADAIQGIGVLPFDFLGSGLDFAIGGSHKWMTSPLGVGFLAARPEAFAELEPTAVGCITYGSPADPNYLDAVIKKGPSRFEPGGRPMIEMAALGAAAELFDKTGIDRIAQEAEFLAKRLRHGLLERGYHVLKANGNDQRGAIVTFRATDVSKHRSLAEMEIALGKARVTFARRAGGVRLSPHAFNTIDDIEQTLATL